MVDKIYKKKNLELAWQKVRQNRGVGGIDGQSIEEFEVHLAENLADCTKNSRMPHIPLSQFDRR